MHYEKFRWFGGWLTRFVEIECRMSGYEGVVEIDKRPKLKCLCSLHKNTLRYSC